MAPIKATVSKLLGLKLH